METGCKSHNSVADALLAKACVIAVKSLPDGYAWKHTKAVAVRCRDMSPLERIVAWLHDVVEDTPLTIDDIAREFPVDVTLAVDAITRRNGESYSDYIARCCRNPVARRVKEQDLRANLAAVDTLTESLRKRYEAALAVVAV